MKKHISHNSAESTKAHFATQDSSSPHFTLNNTELRQTKQNETERLDRLMEFLHIIIASMQQDSTKAHLDSLLQEFSSLTHTDIKLLANHSNGKILLFELIALLRDRIYTLLTQGALCGVEYLSLLLFTHISTYTKLENMAQDTRFDVFITMAQNNLFADGNSDVENLLFIELYIVAKILRDMGNFDRLMLEYISLICLVDINLPLSLEHANFIIKHFENLGVDMSIMLNALKNQLNKEVYFAYPSQRRRSILNWQLHCFWNVSHFFNHHAWLELYVVWKELFYTMLENGSNGGVEGIDEAMYMQFFMYHLCGNNFHTQEQWARFCKDIDRVAVRHYERFAKSQGIYGVSNHQPTDKIRIGILRDRLVANSPYKVEFSLLSNLLSNKAFKERYEIRIYAMKLFEKSVDDEKIVQSYENLGIPVIDVVSGFHTQGFYNSHLQKALAIKEALNTDNISILLSPNNGYGISDFILASRSAKTQIYYSHGNFVYDVPCVDSKMTHICQNKRRISHEGYEFYGVPVKMLERFYNPPLDSQAKEKITQIRSEFPQDSVILGSIGRLVKLNSKEYWQCVIAIMQRYPQSIYLACGGGNESLVSECITSCFTQETEAQAFLQRVHFTGYIDSGIYGHIIDIWLDSFPLEQGESRIEYVAKGGLSITLSKIPQEQRLKGIQTSLQAWQSIPHKDGSLKTQADFDNAFALIKESQLPLLAFSLKEYVEKAAALLEHFVSGDRAYIENLRELGAKARAVGDEMKEYEGILAFIDAITQTQS